MRSFSLRSGGSRGGAAEGAGVTGGTAGMTCAAGETSAGGRNWGAGARGGASFRGGIGLTIVLVGVDPTPFVGLTSVGTTRGGAGAGTTFAACPRSGRIAGLVGGISGSTFGAFRGGALISSGASPGFAFTGPMSGRGGAARSGATSRLDVSSGDSAGTSTTGVAGGGGGSAILRMPRMRSPLAVLATRDGAGGDGGCVDFPLTWRRTRSAVTSSMELLWLLAATFKPARISSTVVLVSPSSLANSWTRMLRRCPRVPYTLY